MKYAVFWFRRKQVKAHRFAWQVMTCMPVPRDRFVLHRCDNTACVNTDHLFLGTHQDNMDDKVVKGRQARADRVFGRLSWPIVREIRSRFGSGTETKRGLAREYEISDTMVRMIVAGRVWKDDDPMDEYARAEEAHRLDEQREAAELEEP